MSRIVRLRSRGAFTAAAAFVALAVACSDASLDPLGDVAPPTVELTAVPAPETEIAFVVGVRDNLGIKTISVRLSGGINVVRDTTFTSAVTSTNLTFRFAVPPSIPPGTAVMITASAIDGAGNESVPATLMLGVGNLEAANVRITAPASGTIAIIGKSLVMSISATSPLKVRAVGFQATGVLNAIDSTVFSSPLSDSVAVLDTLAIPENTAAGQLVLTPFSVDSLGQRTFGPAVNLSVQTAASTNSIPEVNFGINSRIEVTDTIHVSATDQTGIVYLGYEVRRTVGGVIDARDSLTSSGTFTTLLHTFTMHLPYTEFPTQIFVQAFAVNEIGIREYAKLPNGNPRVDTVTVVAGNTKALPQGGAIADAFYHPGKDRLYLTNIDRNRLEVFALADTSFKPAVSTGSRPWGLAPWPRNRSGDVEDMLLVAHSGGTSIGYVDLNAGASGSLVYNYPLPNIVVNTITSEQSATVPGLIIQVRKRHEFSDRPQYLAATCQGDPNSGPCGDVVVVYSTTPTAGQSSPFERRGTLRAENLSNNTSHFFFEHAMGQQGNRADTLEIIRFAAGGVGGNEVPLVPYKLPVQSPAGDSVSIVVNVERIGFRDTTFARNSGNFRRAVFGEGGPVLGSRIMMYDASLGRATGLLRDGVTYTFFPGTSPIDLGVSPAHDVSDIIANAFARVGGAAINFDGELAAIRGDSTYLVDPTLRLQGLLQTSGGNPGFDFHPLNRGNTAGGGAPEACFSFAASSEPVLEVYENRHYSRVAAIPIRDPIIGPIKAARRAASGEIVLVGATQGGVVVVRLPDVYTGCP